MKPTDTLREEHNLELAVTRAAEHEVRFMHDTGECRFEVVETIVDFFHYFTRACHEPKEESLIFARMATRGLPADHGILAELTREHEEFRRRIKEISQWLRDRRAGKTVPVAQLESMLDDYLKLMRAHVSKENDILLPLANQLLTDLDQVEIESVFAALECEQTMVGVREKYNELAHQLANRPTEVLFPMVGHVLSPADQEELTRRYESAEAEEITKGVHDRYFDLAHELAVA